MVTGSIEGSVLHDQNYRFTIPPNPGLEGRIEVTSEDVVTAARRLSSQNAVILNFASAKNVGGGWTGNARAQEESIMRSSALYASVRTHLRYYQYNRNQSLLYSDNMIYSPNVPFFRDGRERLIDEPFQVSVITAPAVNAGAMNRHNNHGETSQVYPVMLERCRKILCCAIEHGHRTITLGAYGCGVFRLDPRRIAGIFHQLLIGEGLRGYFDYILFPIPPGRKNPLVNITPFLEVFQVPFLMYTADGPVEYTPSS